MMSVVNSRHNKTPRSEPIDANELVTEVNSIIQNLSNYFKSKNSKAAKELLSKVHRISPLDNYREVNSSIEILTPEIKVEAYYSFFGERSFRIKIPHMQGGKFSINDLAKSCISLLGDQKEEKKDERIAANHILNWLLNANDELNKNLKNYSLLFRIIVWIRDQFSSQTIQSFDKKYILAPTKDCNGNVVDASLLFIVK